MKEVVLTQQGHEKLAEEIEYLKSEKRREVAERIRVAREFGDIAENAEYDDAKTSRRCSSTGSPSSRSGCCPPG